MNMCIKSRGQYFEKGPVTGRDSESDEKIFVHSVILVLVIA